MNKSLSTLLILAFWSIGAIAEIGDSNSAERQQQQQQQWRKAIEDFAVADAKTVIGPYMNIISELHAQPEHRWCQPSLLSKINQAIELNPSSLVAHSMLFSCATKANKRSKRKEYLNTINGLISLLVDANEATSLENVIEIRELMEAPLLLQAMGYSVLDMDLLTRYGGIYYRYHVIDLETSKVSVRYFSNLQFMKRMLSNPDVSDDTASQLMSQHYEQQQMSFAINRKAKQLLLTGKAEQAQQLLEQFPSYSMHKNVLLAQIYIKTEQTDALELIKPELELNAKSGYMPAAVLLAQAHLKNNDLDSTKQQLSEIDHFSHPGEGAYQLARAMLQLNDQDHDSVQWFEQAVALKHPKAAMALAKLYRNGQLVAQDHQQAFKLFETAYGYGLTEAAVQLVGFYHRGSETTPEDHQKELSLLHSLAEQNEPTAHYILGQRYAKGVDVEQDSQQALKWYTSAYQLGEVQAANPIGILYERGLLAPPEKPQQPNYPMAEQWYEKAGLRGDSHGFINLARLYQFGIERPVDIKKAGDYYVKAAEAGSMVAYCKLADTLLIGGDLNDELWSETVKKAASLYQYGAKGNSSYCPRRLGYFYQNYSIDKAKAQQWYELAAQNGDQPASEKLEQIYFDSYLEQDYEKALINFAHGTRLGLAKSSYYLGLMYHQGLGIKRNDIKALALWQNALKLNFKLAEKAIILLYYQGQPEVRDQQKAEQLMQQLAERSLEDIQDVANWFFYGLDTEVDYPKAQQFLLQAAEAGSPRAMNHLGEMYRFGWGVEIDYDKAVYWYQQAFAQDYSLAIHNIAEMYYYGNGTPVDYKKAYVWFEKAAARGVAPSQYFLGLMHQQGQGTTADPSLANRWYQLAMEQRHEGAKFALGKNLLQGIGTNKNPARGRLYIIEAAEAGYQQAIDHLTQ